MAREWQVAATHCLLHLPGRLSSRLKTTVNINKCNGSTTKDNEEEKERLYETSELLNFSLLSSVDSKGGTAGLAFFGELATVGSLSFFFSLSLRACSLFSQSRMAATGAAFLVPIVGPALNDTFKYYCHCNYMPSSWLSDLPMTSFMIRMACSTEMSIMISERAVTKSFAVMDPSPFEKE